MNSQLQVCPVCGGRRVQQKAWIDVNTRKILDANMYEADDTYCPDCGNSAGTITEHEFNENNLRHVTNDCKFRGETIARMLRSILPVEIDPANHSQMVVLLEQLTDEQINDIAIRLKILETFDLALEQHNDCQEHDVITEMTIRVRNGGSKYISIVPGSPYAGQSAYIPNRIGIYQSIEQFANELHDLKKINSVIDFEGFRSDDLPF